MVTSSRIGMPWKLISGIDGFIRRARSMDPESMAAKWKPRRYIETYGIDVVVRRHERDAKSANGAQHPRPNPTTPCGSAGALHVAPPGMLRMYGFSRPCLGLPCDNPALALNSRDAYRG